MPDHQIIQGDFDVRCPFCNRESPLAMTGRPPGLYEIRCPRCGGIFEVNVNADHAWIVEGERCKSIMS